MPLSLRPYLCTFYPCRLRRGMRAQMRFPGAITWFYHRWIGRDDRYCLKNKHGVHSQGRGCEGVGK